MHKIFVYGTLKTGGYFWKRALAPKVGVVDAISGFDLYDLGSFPAMVKAKTDKPVVHGEVFSEVDDATLAMLDRIEGVPMLYSRDEVITHEGEKCWVYHMNKKPTRAQRLPDGVWTDEGNLR